MASKTLHFVYNANSGSLSAVKDSLHKLVSPQTYQCDLCALTHNALGEVAVWKKFRESVDLTTRFYHKNEFEKAFRSKWLPKYDYPLILIETDRGLEVFISSTELKQLETVEQLIKAIENKRRFFD